MATLPRSVSNMYINVTALAVSLLALWWLVAYGGEVSPLLAVGLLCSAYAVPVVVLESLWLRSWRQTLNTRARALSWSRTGVKFIGLVATCAAVVSIYWLLPEYHGSFYDRYYTMLRALAPWFFGLAPLYIALMDRYSKQERDGYWHVGMALLGQWQQVDWSHVKQHALGWLVKLFFLPLMFIYMTDKVAYLRQYDFSMVFSSFKAFYDFAYQGLFYIDLLIVTVGYMATFTATDSHIRSTESTFLGWAVALACYQPFWSFVSANYISYDGGKNWGAWFWHEPLLYTIWGSAILILIAIYAWASIPFGIRFSNLTHRGILTNGPYRYCKHPAYVSKNLSWWLISMPFMISTSAEESLRHCLLLLMLNGIYFLRARTEERHLSWDPDYVAYAQYIEEHGTLRKLGQWFPVLRFKRGQLLNL
jgi:hypothetical protein